MARLLQCVLDSFPCRTGHTSRSEIQGYFVFINLGITAVIEKTMRNIKLLINDAWVFGNCCINLEFFYP